MTLERPQNILVTYLLSDIVVKKKKKTMENDMQNKNTVRRERKMFGHRYVQFH